MGIRANAGTRTALIVMGGTLVVVAIAIAALEIRMRSGTARADEAFATDVPERITDLGATKTLSILPLIDWHTGDPNLQTEMGVSYLIRTDEHSVLFDVGHNVEQVSPSPLQQNMKALGLSMDDFDTIFISHNHFDHVGGEKAKEDETFLIGLEQPTLAGKRAFVPVPLAYPDLNPILATGPAVMGKGLATTGTISRQLVIGWIEEQALAVNVEGRGIVLIVGCGHQTVTKLLKRYDDVFDEPLYGIVGGLHYPVPDGRLVIAGINAQRRLASGEGLLAPLTMSEVERELALLEARNLGLVGLGGHDSSDEVIAMFRERFGSAYHDVHVGKRIVAAP